MLSYTSDKLKLTFTICQLTVVWLLYLITSLHYIILALRYDFTISKLDEGLGTAKTG